MFYIFYGLKKTWQNRVVLSQFLGKIFPEGIFVADTILDYSAEHWQKIGIRVLVLDFDGVLASHGESTLSPSIFNWLKTSVRIFGPERIFILSNRRDPDRDEFFKTQFPELICYTAKYKKPYPNSLLDISEQTHIQLNQILVLDDRLTTGILSGVLAGTPACWIRKPFQNFKKRFLMESFFAVLRKIERVFLSFFINQKTQNTRSEIKQISD